MDLDGIASNYRHQIDGWCVCRHGVTGGPKLHLHVSQLQKKRNSGKRLNAQPKEGGRKPKQCVTKEGEAKNTPGEWDQQCQTMKEIEAGEATEGQGHS